MSFLPLSERGTDSRGQCRADDPRPGDRGAPPAGPGLARARQPLRARPARGRLRGRRGIDRAARPGRSTGSRPGATRSPPRGCTASSCGASRAGWPRRRPRSARPSSTFPGIPCFGRCWSVSCSTSARSPSRAASLSSWLPASSRRCIATTRGSSGSASRPKPARGSATRRPRRSSLSSWRHSPVVTPSPTPRAASGAVDRYLGLLARTVDRLDEAERICGRHHLQRADGSPTVGRSLSARSRRGPPQARASRGCRRGERARPSGPRDRRALGMALAHEIGTPEASPDAPPGARSCRVGRLSSRGGVLDDRVRAR